MPKVSICVPNLNTRPYLPERFETVFNQTFQDWELVVCDSYSDDGSWEYIQELAAREPRMQITQTPRGGIYQGINDCIERARGELIYIATSDDTIANDCIEKLVAALNSNATCDIAHCPLRVIDEVGEGVEFPWAEKSAFARSTGELLNRPHIRMAPYDGFLHLGAESVYISVTQLLIRRSLFERIGVFDTRWGSAGDFHWAMRAGLVANVVHVPNTWAGWRIRSGQATDLAAMFSMAHRQKIEAIIDDAINVSAPKLSHKLRRLLRGRRRRYYWERWKLQFELAQHGSRAARASYLLRRMATGSGVAWLYLFRWLRGIGGWDLTSFEIISYRLRQSGYETLLRPI